MAGTVNTEEYKVLGTTSGSISVKAGASPTTHDLVLPATQGAAGEVMENDGSGNLSNVRRVPRLTTAFWHTQNGYGSTNSAIQKFTTEIDASDDIVVTIVNSATLGFSVTANMACKLHISFTFEYNTATASGLSLNSSQLSTGIDAISATDRLHREQINAANHAANVSWSGILATNDVVRPHANGSADSTTPARSLITILAEEIL